MIEIFSGDFRFKMWCFWIKNAFDFSIVIILIQVLSVVAVTNSTNIRHVGVHLEHSTPVPFSISVAPMATRNEEDEFPSNAPLMPCGRAGGVEDGQYIEVFRQYMDPLCEDVQGYCRLKRNQNYTAMLGFIPKVEVQSLTVRVTSVRRPIGWETLFGPDFAICGKVNLTCPQEPNVPVQAYNEGELDEKVPPTRGLYRLRLLGTSTEDETKRPYLCRQIYLQFY